MRRRLALAVLVLAVALLGPHVRSPRARAQDPVVLRLATLAPRGSPGEAGFRRWDRLLRERTSGRLGVRVLYGGAAGDERLVVRKLRLGQLDGATLTTTGLGLAARAVLVLQAPGVLTSYAKLDAARAALAPELAGELDAGGLVLLGWGDAGRIRVFSTDPVRRPADLRARRPWVWPDNPILVELVRACGATGVPAGLLEVLPALQTGRIDTVTTSALGALALQWATRLRFVTRQSSSVVVGAMVLAKPRFDALPEDLRQALRDTAGRMTGPVNEQTRRLDDQAYDVLVRRGMTALDVTPHRAEWERVQRETRTRLAGRLYSRALLERVEQAAAATPD